jgi:hypothetical protein
MTILKLVKNAEGKYDWADVDSMTPSRKGGKEDLTVDGFINKHGAIFSHADSKMHYSKRSYLDGIKAAGCHIKDYK